MKGARYAGTLINGDNAIVLYSLWNGDEGAVIEEYGLKLSGGLQG